MNSGKEETRLKEPSRLRKSGSPRGGPNKPDRMRKEGRKAMIDKATYINAKGLICPHCGADSIEGGFIEVEAGEALQDMSCCQCRGKWQDIYHLVDVVPLGKEELWLTPRN